MSFTIEQNLLKGPDISRVPTLKNREKFKAGLPDTIVIHYTAGSSGKSSADWLSRDWVRASAHVVIDRSGHIFQLVPFDIVAWHAGISRWKEKKGLNRYSIGIELDNAGLLQKTHKGYFSKITRRYYPEDDVLFETHRHHKRPEYWHKFTTAQIEACETLCRKLIERFPSIREIVGHEEISPGRKIDPGPAFPLDDFREKILPEVYQESEEAKVAARFLNIREYASRFAPKVSDPLTKDTKVIVLEEHDEWKKVKVNNQLTGWVHGGFLKAA